MGKGKDTLLSGILKIMIIFFASTIALLLVFFFMMRFIIGGNKIEVPNVIGKSFREAFNILNQKKLRITVDGHKYSAELPEDYVVEQRPGPGQKIKADRAVKVFLSRGSETGTVPRVIGQDITESESILRAVGLEMGMVARVHSDDYPQPGTVMAQTPPPNIKIERGSKVNLLVSLGSYATQVSVPDLGGIKLQNAIRMLESVGLRPGNIRRQESALIREPDVVLEQSPQPDDRIEKGSTVNLVVSPEMTSGETKTVVFRYKVPADPKDITRSRRVKVILEHEGGSRVIADDILSPGTSMEYPLRIMGKGIAKIYIDDMESPMEMMDL